MSGKAPAHASVPGVVFHGQMDNRRVVSELLPTMDIFCLPTRADMSAWVVIEASAAGLPSVASDVGGIRELIRDGESGRLLAPDDDAGFIAALKELIGDPEMRRRYGRRAQTAVAETADAFRNYNSLIDRLKALASGPSAAEIPGRIAV